MRRFKTRNKIEKEWAWELLNKQKSFNMNPNIKHKLKEAAKAEAQEVERIRGKKRSIHDEIKVEQNKTFAKLIDPELEQQVRDIQEKQW